MFFKIKHIASYSLNVFCIFTEKSYFGIFEKICTNLNKKRLVRRKYEDFNSVRAELYFITFAETKFDLKTFIIVFLKIIHVIIDN